MVVTDMIDKMVDKKVEASTKLWRKETKELNGLLTKQALDFQKTTEDLQTLQAQYNQQQEVLKLVHQELKHVHQELRTHVALTNHIKQRIILERARIQIIGLLDKSYLEFGQSWK